MMESVEPSELESTESPTEPPPPATPSIEPEGPTAEAEFDLAALFASSASLSVSSSSATAVSAAQQETEMDGPVFEADGGVSLAAVSQEQPEQEQEQEQEPAIPVEKEGEALAAADGEGTNGAASDGGESVAAAAEEEEEEEAEGHTPPPAPEEVEEGGADGADGQVFTSIDISASSSTESTSAPPPPRTASPGEEEPVLQGGQENAEEQGSQAHGDEQLPLGPAQPPPAEVAPPPAPEPEKATEEVATLGEAVPAEAAESAAVVPIVIAEVVLAEREQQQEGESEQQQEQPTHQQPGQQTEQDAAATTTTTTTNDDDDDESEQQGERDDDEALALAAAVLGPVPSPLPRPRVLPLRLNIPTATTTTATTTAPAPHPATPTTQEAPPPNWPLFHSPRGGLVPLSPSAATAAPLAAPTAAGHAHLETQPSQDDGYEDERLGDDFLASPWLSPSHDRAERYREANTFREGRAPILPKGLCGRGHGGSNGGNGGGAGQQSPAPSPTPLDDEQGAGAVEAARGERQPQQHQDQGADAEAEGEQERANLSELGVGVHLHFKLLKALFWGFLVLAVLHLPALLLYRSGARLPRDKVDLLGSYRFTLGNMGIDPLWDLDGADDVAIPMHFPGLGITLFPSPHDAGVILASCEVVSCIVFAFLIVYTHHIIGHAKREHKRRVLTTKDFAVFVTGLPKHVTKAEIIDHFSDLYPLDRPDWKGRPPPPPTGRPKRPVADLAHVGGDRRYEGRWVAEVVIARRNGEILQTALQHKDKALQIRRLRAQVKRYGPTTAPEGGADPVLFQRYQRDLDKLEASMRGVAQQMERNPSVSRAEQESVGAFVLFEYPESARRCLEDHNSMNLLHFFCFQHTLLFNGRHRLTVRPAPAPDDVMWENLELPSWYRFGRRLVVNIATLVILVISFAFIIALTQQKTQLAAKLPDLSLCSREIPALYMGGDYGRVNASLQLVGFKDRTEAESACAFAVPGAKSIYAFYSYDHQNMVVSANYNLRMCSTANACPFPLGIAHCPCLLTVTSSTSDFMCQTVPCFPGFEGTGTCKRFPYSLITSCFCLARLQDAVKGGFSFDLLTGWEFKLPACQAMADSLMRGALLQVLLSLLTLSISISILPPVVKGLTAWERHRSADREASHVLTRLFLAQFLNVAILLLIVYGGHPSIQAASPTASGARWARALRTMGIFAGPYRDVDVDWYAEVGTQLYLNALICVLSPHVWPLLQCYVVAPAQRRWAVLSEAWSHKPRFVMQRDLNALYVGPAFDITTRTAQALSMTFLALLFSTGMPLMPLLAMLAFGASYVVDYCLLLRFYQRPPQRDERLHLKLCQTLPYALVLHLCMAIWMLSNTQVMSGSSSSSSSSDDGSAAPIPGEDAGIHVVLSGLARITQPHVLPLFLFLLLNILYFLMLPFRQVTALLARISAALKATCCSGGVGGGNGGKARGRRLRWRVGSEPTMQLDVLNDNGFSKVYERPLPPERLAPGAAPRADAAGWQDVYNEQGAPVQCMRRNKSPRVSSSPATSPRHGAAAAGPVAYRRTWEVLKSNGLWSYELHRCPRYRDAVLAFAREFCPAQTSKVGQSLRGSYWGGQGAWRPTVVVPRVDEEAVLREQARQEQQGVEARDEEEGRGAGVEA